MAKAHGTTRSPSQAFQVKPVLASHVAAMVLEELSRSYSSDCNYLDAALLARNGDIWLAYQTVKDTNARNPAYSARVHWVQAQAEGVLKKLVDPSFDRWGPTKALWFRTEKRCARLNQKFTALTNRHVRGDKPLPYHSEFQRFREALAYVLGEEPPIEDILDLAHYGPGSSTDVRGSEVHYARKIESTECTPLAVELGARSLARDKAIWEQHGLRPEYAVGNTSAFEGAVRVIREALTGSVNDRDRLLFIHKGLESLRSIGAQPTVSGHLQLGVHEVGVNLLLHRANINLADQGRNQVFAQMGSKDWQSDNPICTLDKSNASNLIARMLITVSFPSAWAKLLHRLRTPRYDAPAELGGQTHVYEMYAGMGNGTTFFVETLIFWAASFATSDFDHPSDYAERGTFAIYGDDVALRRDHAERYMRFAKFLGFQFNTKKTFTDGPFRESCGCDYYDGVDVRPAILSCETQALAMSDIIGFHNTLMDQPNFQLPRACAMLRKLWKSSMHPVLPTDPQGQNGFRPPAHKAGYDIAKDKSGTPLLSQWWQRPRYFVLDRKQKVGSLGDIGAYTQLAVAAMRARQSESGLWTLPLRDRAQNMRVVPERDMERPVLVQMLANTLTHLAQRKGQPWYKESRGIR